jgi:hypothetical protein
MLSYPQQEASCFRWILRRFSCFKRCRRKAKKKRNTAKKFRRLKGAIIAYTRSPAVELAHKGIRLNAIAPGWVTVENYYKMIPGFNDQEARKVAHEKVPLGRSGEKPSENREKTTASEI